MIHRFRFPSVVLVTLLRVFFPSTATAQSLDQVLSKVSENVKQFQDFLPDFVCQERITSTRYESGRVIKQKTVDSIFTGAQQSSEENRLRFAFKESRELVAIDGKPVSKKTAFPKLPYAFSGGYSSLLITTFAPDNVPYHNYSIGDSYKSEKTDALLLKFSTKEGQQKLRSVLQKTQFVSKDTGAAWIDRTSFQVIRLQRQSLNLPSDLTRSIATADYGPVTIEEYTFWMPTRIRAEVTERDTQSSVSYVAEYTDCKKFTAEIRLLQ